jgi:TonB family protein
MRVILIGLGLALAAPPAFASPVDQALEPLRISPVHTVRHGQRVADPTLLQIPATEVVCDGATIQPAYAEDMRIEATRLYPNAPQGADKPDVVLRFAVDETGRTRDIRPLSTPSSSDEIVVSTGPSTDQEQAVLAAWRFSGGPRRDCRLTIRYTAKPVVEAGQGDLLRYFAVTRTRGALRDAVAARLAGPDANCGGDRRGGRWPRTVSYPDNKIGRPPPPGGRSWTVLRWGVDAQGRAVDVETLGSSGDTAFDAETRRAVSDTVVEGGAPLKGCVYNFYRGGGRLPAPETPQRDEDLLQNCPDEIGSRFKANAAPDSFPVAFRERGIEGWALVRFDLATWGQVGNVEVIDAQPAAAFGDSGRRTVQAGRAEPSNTAGVRCVVPVRYSLLADADGGEPTQAQTDAIADIATD